jgi:hypothetical protein
MDIDIKMCTARYCEMSGKCYRYRYCNPNDDNQSHDDLSYKCNSSVENYFDLYVPTYTERVTECL